MLKNNETIKVAPTVVFNASLQFKKIFYQVE